MIDDLLIAVLKTVEIGAELSVDIYERFGSDDAEQHDQSDSDESE